MRTRSLLLVLVVFLQACSMADLLPATSTPQTYIHTLYHTNSVKHPHDHTYFAPHGICHHCAHPNARPESTDLYPFCFAANSYRWQYNYPSTHLHTGSTRTGFYFS
jgi:hypothetical protein